MQVALGIFLSEMFVALLCFFGLSRYFTTPTFQLVFTGMAAAAILYLGIQSVFTKHHKLPEIKVSASASVYRGFFHEHHKPVCDVALGECDCHA